MTDDCASLFGISLLPLRDLKALAVLLYEIIWTSWLTKFRNILSKILIFRLYNTHFPSFSISSLQTYLYVIYDKNFCSELLWGKFTHIHHKLFLFSKLMIFSLFFFLVTSVKIHIWIIIVVSYVVSFV